MSDSAVVFDVYRKLSFQKVSPTDEFDHFDEKAEKALLDKVTWRLIPFIGWLYMLSFLDRVNLANVHGTIKIDLNLSETDYSNAVGVFFLGYCLFELPSNLIMQKVQPRLWIARILITWGGITCLLATCFNRDSLIAGRFFLGVAEAGFFPGMIFYLTSWYTPEEMSSRIALFFSTSAVAGVVGGLLAYGLLQMEGWGGLHGWQLLFLFEGVPSVLSGFACMWLLPNEPRGSDFLTDFEQRFLEHRLEKSRRARLELHQQHQQQTHHFSFGNASPKSSESFQSTSSTAAPPVKKQISWDDLFHTIRDWRVWALTFLYLMVLITLYSLSFFLPAIIGQFGFSVLKSNLLSVPIYGSAAIFTIFISWSSDRRKERYIHCAIPAIIASIGFLVMATQIDSDHAMFKFFLLLILVSVCWCLVPPILALLMAILKSPTSSATGSAVCVSCANIGGYLGPTICSWSKTGFHSYGPACYFFAACTFILAVGMMWLRHVLRNEVSAKFSFDQTLVQEIEADDEEAMEDADTVSDLNNGQTADPQLSSSPKSPKAHFVVNMSPASASDIDSSFSPLPTSSTSNVNYTRMNSIELKRSKSIKFRPFIELHSQYGLPIVALDAEEKLEKIQGRRPPARTMPSRKQKIANSNLSESDSDDDSSDSKQIVDVL